MFLDWRIRKLAKGQASEEDIVIMLNGPSPATDNDQTEWEELSQKERKREELKHRHQEAEQKKKGHSSPYVLAGWLAGLVLMEVSGCLLIMDAIGVGHPERFVVAGSLAASVFVCVGAMMGGPSDE